MSTAPGSRTRGSGTPRPSAQPGARPAARRPGPRPGVRGVTGASATAASAVRRAPAHVRRMVVLVGIFVVMALVVGPSLSGYLQQRAEISTARADLQLQQAEIARLEQELARWEDDAYVEQQARERLRFVKEGETAFTVIDDTGTELTEALPGMAPVSDDVLATSPWYGQVWASVTTANQGLPETQEP